MTSMYMYNVYIKEYFYYANVNIVYKKRKS